MPTNEGPEAVGERRGLWAALKETTFRSLRHRNYRRYFLGQIISFTGSWMQSAALMWLLFDRTGDPRWPSWILVAQVGPTILLGAFGGGLADRYPKRQLIFITQATFLVHATVLCLLIAFDILSPWLILGLMAISGVVQAVDLPARLAYVPDLIPKEDLINAVGLNSLLFNSARAFGPACAGLLFLLAEAVLPYFPSGSNPVTIGAVACFALNAISFVAVLFALWGITVSGSSQHGKKAGGGSVWDGFRYLAQHPTMGGLVLLTLSFCIFGWPLLTILPAYTRLILNLGEQTYSLLVAAVGAGALIAALTTATFGTTARRGKFLVVGASAASIGLLGLSLSMHPEFAMICCAAAGFGLILYLSTGQSIIQLAVPNEMRGRVMALWAITLSASAPLGHLLAGQLVTLVGVGPVLKGMAAGVGLVAIVLGWLLSLHRVGK
ncbi:MAG TPA: MFS transporter [Gemmata sp.]|nr:MFS transporter [Gemmata sp.]